MGEAASWFKAGLSGVTAHKNRAAFDSGGVLWQGARPDAATRAEPLLDFRARPYHQCDGFLRLP